MSAFAYAAPLELERQVIGASLTLPADFEAIRAAGLVPADLESPANALILATQLQLDAEGAPTDERAVRRRLERDEQLDEVGGTQYLASLTASVDISGRAGYYAGEVRNAARTREVHAIGAQLREIRELNGDATALTERLRELLTQSATVAIRTADLSRVRPIRWAWRGRLLLGYLNLLLGAEGVGKGTLAAHLLGRLSRGQLPGDLEGTPARILILGDEDAFDSVWVPRLYAAGADLDMVDTLEDEFDLTGGADPLRRLVEQGGYKVVFFDQLLDNLGVDVDDWRSKEVRDRLRPARRVARELDVLMLGALHPNKGQRASFRDLVSGSHAFNASSRSSLLLAQHPEDEDRRILVRGKGNLSAAPPSFEFSIEGRELEINGHHFSLPIVANPVDGDLSIEDVMRPAREAPVRQSLADQIDALGTGDVQKRADLARALGREPDDRSVGRALDQLEAEDRWAKVGRGQWQAVRLGIGTYRDVPMSKQPAGQETAA